MINKVELTINQRFEKVFNHLKETGKIRNKTDFANKVGVYQQQMVGYFNGQRKISNEMMINASNQFDVSFDWLLTGKGEMIRTKENNNVPTDEENIEKFSLFKAAVELVEKKYQQLLEKHVITLEEKQNLQDEITKLKKELTDHTKRMK